MEEAGTEKQNEDGKAVVQEKSVVVNFVSKDDAYLSGIYKDLVSNVRSDSLNTANIINIITKCIELVETLPNRTGLEKKTFVLQLVKQTIVEFANEELKPSLISFVDVTGPSLIDTLIFVSKGKLAVNVKKWWSKWMAKCC